MNEMEKELVSTKINDAKITHHTSRTSMTLQDTSDHATKHELIKGTMARTIPTNPNQFTSDTCHTSAGFSSEVYFGGRYSAKTNETKERIFKRFAATRGKCMY